MTAAHREKEAKTAYASMDKNGADCQKCRRCEKECPQMIKVSEVMPGVHALFEKINA